jgi:hypothetical protein
MKNDKDKDLEYLQKDFCIWEHDQFLKELELKKSTKEPENKSNIKGFIKSAFTLGLGAASYYLAKGMHSEFKETSKR